MTTDRAAAAAFYRVVAGWTAQDIPVPGMIYTVMKNGDAMVAGIMNQLPDARSADMRPSWFGYIGVDDVDAAARRVAQGGGKVHRPPCDIPDVGRFAVVADPQGAVFMLFKPIEPGPAAPPMAPGHVGWHGLFTSDGARAFDFYAGQFGWAKGEAIDTGMGPYQIFDTGSGPAGGIMTLPSFAPGEGPAWLFYVNVDGIDAAVRRAKENGGTVTMGPEQVPGGRWIAHCRKGHGLCALVPRR